MYKIANLDCNSIEEKILDLLNSNIILTKTKITVLTTLSFIHKIMV